MTSTASGCASAALLLAVRNAALALTPLHGRRLADVLARYEGPSPTARGEAMAVAPVPTYRRAAADVLGAWELEPAVSGVVMAAALAAAVDTADAVRATQSIDVVWTGPSSAEVPVRLTREVLLEVIDAASCSLVVISYAAYRVPDIIAAIRRCSERGVDIRLVLESSTGSGGRLSLDAAAAFSDVRNCVRFYEWAADRRASADGAHGAMHAKAAIADEQIAFVTSANLTGRAIEANMELGVLVRGGAVPKRLSRHLLSLIAAGILSEV